MLFKTASKVQFPSALFLTPGTNTIPCFFALSMPYPIIFVILSRFAPPFSLFMEQQSEDPSCDSDSIFPFLKYVVSTFFLDSGIPFIFTLAFSHILVHGKWEMKHLVQRICFLQISHSFDLNSFKCKLCLVDLLSCSFFQEDL